MNIGVVDYGVGNLGSVANTLGSIGVNFVISNKKSVLKKTDGIILPGDGAAGEGMKNLKKLGLDTFLIDQIKPFDSSQGKPFLGICLGMQLLMEKSEEGNTKCLGVIKGSVKKIKTKMKLPQIGWNTVRIKNDKSRIMKKVEDNSYFYFIHSYVCLPEEQDVVMGRTAYSEEFCTVFEKDTIFGAQFHPEKSGKAGAQMLRNFINIC